MSLLKIVGEKLPPSQRSSLYNKKKLFYVPVSDHGGLFTGREPQLQLGLQGAGRARISDGDSFFKETTAYKKTSWMDKPYKRFQKSRSHKLKAYCCSKCNAYCLLSCRDYSTLFLFSLPTHCDLCIKVKVIETSMSV